MGAWGFGSLDNDAALDFVPELINEDAVKKMLKMKHNHAELRATGEILVHLHKLNNLWFHQETIDELVAKLESVLTDQDWMDSWADDGPEVVRASIKKLINKLKKLDGY